MNTVIAGDYKGNRVSMASLSVAGIEMGFAKYVLLDKKNVLRYELADKNTKTGFSVGKAVMGAAAFGDIGVVAGSGGKTKSTYRVAVYFRDGKQSLLEVDGKIYKAIEAELFGVENYRPAPPPPPMPKNVKQKTKSHALARVVIWFAVYFVMFAIARSVFPVVDGVPQATDLFKSIGIILPTLAAIFLPKFIFREKK